MQFFAPSMLYKTRDNSVLPFAALLTELHTYKDHMTSLVLPLNYNHVFARTVFGQKP